MTLKVRGAGLECPRSFEEEPRNLRLGVDGNESFQVALFMKPKEQTIRGHQHI
jgi:hypothetical protein